MQESTERSETPLLALTGRVPTRPDQPCTDVHHSAPSDRPNASRPSPQARDARNPTVFWQNTGTVAAGRSRVLCVLLYVFGLNGWCVRRPFFWGSQV